MRLIEREKLMIDPTKIILADEVGMIIDEFIPEDSYFITLFEDCGEKADIILDHWVHNGLITYYEVPLYMTEEHFVRYYLDVPADVPSDQIYSKAISIIREREEALLGTPVHFEVEGGFAPEEAIQNSPIKALFAQTYFYALAKTALWVDVLDRYERGAVARDEGQIVLDYWKKINAVKDYSGFFPDAKPPHGDKPDDGSGKVRIKGWQPT